MKELFEKSFGSPALVGGESGKEIGTLIGTSWSKNFNNFFSMFTPHYARLLYINSSPSVAECWDMAEKVQLPDGMCFKVDVPPNTT